MVVTKIFDAIFVNQLFQGNERGETVFYPHGTTATGYMVSPEREAGLRSGLRWLVLISVFGSMAALHLLLSLLELWGLVMSVPWIAGVTLLTIVIAFSAIMYVLSRLTAGLEPVSEDS